MNNIPMRRSKLVGSEGPGSLVISPKGETAVVGALDLWFRDSKGNNASEIEEFNVNEPRLKSILEVEKFYTPPEFRGKKTHQDVNNSDLIIPLMRFPRWHYCSKCKSLRKLELDQTTVFLDCTTCKSKKYFKQVPFVVICEKGHLSDFPWKKWVHKDQDTTCDGNLKIKMSEGTTLDSWIVICEKCKSKRGLQGITASKNGEIRTSTLGEKLNKKINIKYTCEGERPWCGDESEQCFAAPVAMLRNSISVYMAKKISALAIPGNHNKNVDLVISRIRSSSNYVLQNMLEIIGDDLEKKIKTVRLNLKFELNETITDQNIEEALMYIEAGREYDYTEEELERPGELIKQKEFEKLTQKVDKEELKVEPEWIFSNNDKDQNYYTQYLERFSRVLKLKETTALYGFDRMEFRNTNDYSSYYPMLYKNYEGANEKWLPVNEVYGEGIFLQLNIDKVKEWEEDENVVKYFKDYSKRVKHIEHRDKSILKPRNIMLHTLSHLIIDELANVSGYNRSAIRERLYLEKNQVGVLIYISAGDSEGTLGGLVRLGLKNKFLHILDKAKNNAEWCSSDPVCKEIGTKQGQGIDNLNGASCHNCSYIPETSCEYWNLYLDRNLLVDARVGFFK